MVRNQRFGDFCLLLLSCHTFPVLSHESCGFSFQSAVPKEISIASWAFHGLQLLQVTCSYSDLDAPSAVSHSFQFSPLSLCYLITEVPSDELVCVLHGSGGASWSWMCLPWVSSSSLGSDSSLQSCLCQQLAVDTQHNFEVRQVRQMFVCFDQLALENEQFCSLHCD